MTIGQKRRSKRPRARVGKICKKKTKRNAKIRRRGVRATNTVMAKKNAPVARVTSQEKPKNATACEGKKVPPSETRASSSHLIPPLGVVPVLVPEVQRLDILRSLVRHLER